MEGVTADYRKALSERQRAAKAVLAAAALLYRG